MEKVSPADTPQFLVPAERDEKSFRQPTVLARVSLHREGTFYRAEYRLRSEKAGPGAYKLTPVGKASQGVLKGRHVWLQVCDGDSREELTSHFRFGLLSFGSLQLKMSHEAAHTLCLYGLGTRRGLSSLQEPFSPILANQRPSSG